MLKPAGRWDWWFAPLDWIKALGPGVPGLIANSDGTFEVHRSHLPLFAALGYPVPATPDAPLRDTVAGMTLRPWQQRALAWAEPRRGTLIVAEPRMGKTATALALHDPARGPLVVLAPLDVRQVWIDWIARVFPGAAVLSLVGRTIDAAAIKAANFIFAHYDIVADQGLVSLAPGTLIVDEAHLLSNAKSRRSAGVRFFAGMAKRVVVLTGTPLWNSTKGLWPLVAAASPGAWGATPFAFQQRYCNTREAPIWLGDMSFKRLGDVRVGDVVMGWVKPDKKHSQSTLVKATVTRVMRHRAAVVKVTMASGAVIRCTADHMWLSGRSGRANRGEHYVTVRPGRALRRMVTSPGRCPAPVDMAYLTGILDGEGTWPKLAQSPTKNPEVHARICGALDRLGFAYYLQPDGIVVKGGRAAAVKFVVWGNPAKRGWLERRSLGGRCFQGGVDEIVSVEPDGEDIVIGLTTTTGNYCAWGYASKNCSPTVGEYGWIYGEISNEDEWRARRDETVFQADWLTERPDLQPTVRQFIDVPIDVDASGTLDVAAESLRDTDVQDSTIGAIGRYRKLTGLLKVAAVAARALALDEPVVTWSWHKEVAKAIAKITKAAGRPTFMIHGDESAPKRLAAIAAWRQTPNGILCATLAVGQVGIDLSHAVHALFAEVDWTPAVLYQAEMRTFTPDRPMYSYFFRVTHPVEQLLVDKLLQKLARGAASAMPAAGSGFDLTEPCESDAVLLAALDAILSRTA